jgi:hypothetical protein
MLEMGKPLKSLQKHALRIRVEGHPSGVSHGKVGGPLRDVPRPELIALLHYLFVQLADVRPDGPIKDAHRQHLTCRENYPTP